ncbi:response regulator [Candidatus Beckwithbacteria bacterium]|nr:response regulator [Candidatus Beckwithbacteria bacterium]
MGYSLLIIEDDKLLGKAIQNALTEASFKTFWSKEWTEAEEVLKNNHIDLIFLDIMLPGIDGYEILKTLKADPKYQQITVVMLSNFGQMNEIDRAMSLGASDYIVKANIDLEDLVELANKKLTFNK